MLTLFALSKSSHDGGFDVGIKLGTVSLIYHELEDEVMDMRHT